MKNIETRKTIALATTAVWLAINVYCTVTGKTIDGTFNTMVSAIVGYYFAKSTALEQPKQGSKMIDNY
jgi:hypothetical protein